MTLRAARRGTPCARSSACTCATASVPNPALRCRPSRPGCPRNNCSGRADWKTCGETRAAPPIFPVRAPRYRSRAGLPHHAPRAPSGTARTHPAVRSMSFPAGRRWFRGLSSRGQAPARADRPTRPQDLPGPCSAPRAGFSCRRSQRYLRSSAARDSTSCRRLAMALTCSASMAGLYMAGRHARAGCQCSIVTWTLRKP